MTKTTSKRNLKNICNKIKLVVTDVDGVLTDGGMYYSEKGEMLKKFNTRDGMGVELLLKKGIKTIFLTKENSQIAKQRGKKVKAVAIYTGIKNKEEKLSKICRRFLVNPDEIAYIGDDVNDLKIMELVGLSGTPLDGVKEVRLMARYVCKLSGGNGAFREFVNFILSNRTI